MQLLAQPRSDAAEASSAADVTPEAFRDEQRRFSLLRPRGWPSVEKPGAAVLFKDPSSAINTLGVTVAPAKLDSLSQFGDLQSVAERLAATERAKDGTVSVEVLATNERKTRAGAVLYEVSYAVEHATRGKKRVLNAVCIDGRQLFILALQFKAGGESEPPVASVAESIVCSFEPGGSDADAL